MRISNLAKAALLTSTARPTLSFTNTFGIGNSAPRVQQRLRPATGDSRRFMTTEMSPLKHIRKPDMEDILESLEQEQEEEEGSGYVVIDVRGEDEIAYTGKLSPKVHTLPLPVIMQLKVFEMDDDEFEEVCFFPKPALDDTIVFTCAAGIRSQQAAYFASMAGYTNLVNYMGGASEWFSGQ
jgi:rhodanese-related sulfurtransferase